MRWFPGLLLAVCLALPFGMGAGAPAPAAFGTDAERLRIISPHRRETRLEYSRAFGEYMRRAHNRDVELVWLDPGGGTSAILRDLETRYADNAADPGVDILFGGGVDPYLRADGRGWLAPVALDAETLAAIPPDCGGIPVRAANHAWFGVALASFGVIYHGRLLDELGLPAPTSWADLGDPRLAGWVAGGNPALSGAVHACYETVLQAYGWERGWPVLAAAAANTRIFGDSASTAPTEVSSGDAAVGMAIQHYAQLAIAAAADPALGYTLPAGQTIVSPDGIAVLRGADRTELAELFVAFVLSAEGQRLLYRPAGEGGQLFSQNRYPVRADAYREPHAPRDNPYQSAVGVAYDNDKGNRRWNLLNDLCQTWLIDAHPQLSAAWREVIRRGSRPAEAAALLAPPLDEAALEALLREEAAETGELRRLRGQLDAAAGGPAAGGINRELRLKETRRVDARMERLRGWAEAARGRYNGIMAGSGGTESAYGFTSEAD